MEHGCFRDIFEALPRSVNDDQPGNYCQLLQPGVAVEKVFPARFAKIKSRQEALRTTFSVFLDIFYPPIFRRFGENGLFQHPQAIIPTTPPGSPRASPRAGVVSVIAMLRQLSSRRAIMSEMGTEKIPLAS